MLVTAHRPSLLHKGRDVGGAPEPLGVHTLLLHHSEIAVPWECAHPEGAHLSLKKTTTTAEVSSVPSAREKVVLLPGASVGARCQRWSWVQHRNRPEDGSSPVKELPTELAGWRLQTLAATRSYMEECLSPSHPWIDSKY